MINKRLPKSSFSLLLLINFIFLSQSIVAQEDSSDEDQALQQKMESLMPGFNEWLYGEMADYARKDGIKQETLDAILPEIQFCEECFKRDSRKVESRMDLDRYLNIFIKQERIEEGKMLLEKHKDVLADIQEQYGIPPAIIITKFAMESSYGSNTGSYSIFESTATVAYITDPTTSKWKAQRKREFLQYFTDALHLYQQGHMEKDQQANYLGASGLFQFMPAALRQYGKDGDGDGRIDIWSNFADGAHSAAYFLARHGWDAGEKVGREILNPGNLNVNQIGSNRKKSLYAHREAGLLLPNGQPIPVAGGISAYIAVPDYRHMQDKEEKKAMTVIPKDWRVFLFYDNSTPVQRYNSSDYYNACVILMAEALQN